MTDTATFLDDEITMVESRMYPTGDEPGGELRLKVSLHPSIFPPAGPYDATRYELGGAELSVALDEDGNPYETLDELSYYHPRGWKLTAAGKRNKTNSYGSIPLISDHPEVLERIKNAIRRCPHVPAAFINA